MISIDLLSTEFEHALLEINRVKAAGIFNRCYSDKNSFILLEELVVNALEKIGEGWEKGTISLAQVYMSGIICEELMEKYLPQLEAELTKVPKIAIAVFKDHHALGKRIVISILRAAGYPVMDFGQGLNVHDLVEKTIENDIEILLISTLMLPSALGVKEVKEGLLLAGVKTKVIVGGAPFRLDPHLWKKVGADVDGKNASSIIKTIEMLVRREIT